MSNEGYFVHQLALGPWDNFIYLIGDRPTRTCAVVDPAWHAPTILVEAEKLDLKITDILCTHSHFDHVDQVEGILATVDARVHMLRPEIEFGNFSCENLVAASAGDTVNVGKHLEITMMHTPGHTPGSTSYRLKDGVLTGDTMFVDGCGRCDFVGGDPEVMYETLHGLMTKLPGDTRIYPGHDYGETPYTTVTEQLETNPFLLQSTLQAFVNRRMEGKTPNTVLPPKPEWAPG